jgi:hypothetical protein
MSCKHWPLPYRMSCLKPPEIKTNHKTPNPQRLPRTQKYKLGEEANPIDRVRRDQVKGNESSPRGNKVAGHPHPPMNPHSVPHPSPTRPQPVPIPSAVPGLLFHTKPRQCRGIKGSLFLSCSGSAVHHVCLFLSFPSPTSSPLRFF